LGTRAIGEQRSGFRQRDIIANEDVHEVRSLRGRWDRGEKKSAFWFVHTCDFV
jgi:hypothetical protein